MMASTQTAVLLAELANETLNKTRCESQFENTPANQTKREIISVDRTDKYCDLGAGGNSYSGGKQKKGVMEETGFFQSPVVGYSL